MSFDFFFLFLFGLWNCLKVHPWLIRSVKFDGINARFFFSCYCVWFSASALSRRLQNLCSLFSYLVVINLYSYVADIFGDLAFFFFFGFLGYKEIGFSFLGFGYLKFIWVFGIRCRRLFWFFVWFIRCRGPWTVRRKKCVFPFDWNRAWRSANWIPW